MERPESIEELMAVGISLIHDIEGQLASSKCQYLNNGSDDSTHRLYTCVSLAHCTRVLHEIGVAATKELEIAVRALSRVHTEAFLVGAYIQFGGIDSIMHIYNAGKSGDVKLENALKEWHTELGAKIKRASRSKRAIARLRNNLEIARSLGRKDTLRSVPEDPLISRPNFVHEVLELLHRSNRDFDSESSAEIQVKQIVDWLAREGAIQGFATQDFEPIYHCYRVMSALGIHTSIHVLDQYMDRSTSKTFVGVLNYPGKESIKNQAIWDAIFGTAQLAEWDLTFIGCDNSLATDVRSALEPGEDDYRGWRAL